MKNKSLVEKYSKTLSSIPEEKFESFKKVLKQRGHIGLLKRVYKDFLKNKSLSKRRAFVYYAREKDLQKAKGFLAENKDMFFDEVVFIQKENLVGGFKVLCCGKFIDKTYKLRLLDLYHKII